MREAMNIWKDIERIGGDRDGPPDAGDLQASMAVSLKRIADSTERATKALETIAGEGFHPEYGIAAMMRARS
jgi:hypothetical protein